MNGRPVLLIDVDGVLCPLGSRGGEPLLDVPGSYARYAEATPGRLQRLSASFELVWATAWEDDANDVLAPLFGLPPLRVVRFDEDEADIGDSWKLPAIARFVRDRPCAWIDDDIGIDSETWAARRKVPTLFLEIAGDCGLAQADVERLEAFAVKVAGS